MRRIARYKKLTKKLPLIRSLLSPRVLRFKRTKWLGVKKVLTTPRRWSRRIQNPLSVKMEYKYWSRIRSCYKTSLLNYSALNLLFENVYSKRSYKRQVFGLKKRTDIFRSLFLAPFFRLDILLWKLQFFKSSFAAKQGLLARNVLVNGCLPTSMQLKRGDIIEIKNIKAYTRLQKFAFIFLYSILEVDYYSNTIVILKDIQETSSRDFVLLLRESFAFRRIINYILR